MRGKGMRKEKRPAELGGHTRFPAGPIDGTNGSGIAGTVRSCTTNRRAQKNAGRHPSDRPALDGLSRHERDPKA
jgi:hypothetical protein